MSSIIAHLTGLVACPKCKSPLRNPQTLPCGHTFCAQPCLRPFNTLPSAAVCTICNFEFPSEEVYSCFLLEEFTTYLAAQKLRSSPLCVGCHGKVDSLVFCQHCSQMVCEKCLFYHAKTVMDALFVKSLGLQSTIKQLVEKKGKIKDNIKKIAGQNENIKHNLEEKLNQFQIEILKKTEYIIQKLTTKNIALSNKLKNMIDEINQLQSECFIVIEPITQCIDNQNFKEMLNLKKKVEILYKSIDKYALVHNGTDKSFLHQLNPEFSKSVLRSELINCMETIDSISLVEWRGLQVTLHFGAGAEVDLKSAMRSLRMIYNFPDRPEHEQGDSRRCLSQPSSTPVTKGRGALIKQLHSRETCYLPNTGLNPRSKNIIRERCPRWPSCPNPRICSYVHPTQNCRNKNCKMGSKCCFLHPSDSLPCTK